MSRLGKIFGSWVEKQCIIPGISGNTLQSLKIRFPVAGKVILPPHYFKCNAPALLLYNGEVDPAKGHLFYQVELVISTKVIHIFKTDLFGQLSGHRYALLAASGRKHIYPFTLVDGV